MLITEPKRTAQPNNRHSETDTVISFECSNESEDDGILKIQLQIEELISKPKRTTQPTHVGNRHGETDTVIILECSSVSQKTEAY